MANITITAAEVRYKLNVVEAEISDTALASASFIPAAAAWMDLIIANNGLTYADLADYKQALLKAAQIANCAARVIAQAPADKNQSGPFTVDPAKWGDRELAIKALEKEWNDTFDMMEIREKPNAFVFSSVGGNDYEADGSNIKNISFSNNSSSISRWS